MNDGAFQAGIAASDCADDLARTDLHQRVVCPGARKPRLEADAGVTNDGSRQEYRVHQREILAPPNVLRARSEVHVSSPPFLGARQLWAGRPAGDCYNGPMGR
jgi:hypothetical protein